MELRYMGFNQALNARAYRFDVCAKGEPTRRLVVTVDLTLFRLHQIGIQEGPALCARKLTSDLDTNTDGVHELTTEDLQSYAAARANAEALRIAARKGGPRRPKPPSDLSQSPWRNIHP